MKRAGWRLPIHLGRANRLVPKAQAASLQMNLHYAPAESFCAVNEFRNVQETQRRTHTGSWDCAMVTMGCDSRRCVWTRLSTRDQSVHHFMDHETSKGSVLNALCEFGMSTSSAIPYMASGLNPIDALHLAGETQPTCPGTIRLTLQCEPSARRVVDSEGGALYPQVLPPLDKAGNSILSSKYKTQRRY